MATPSNLPPVLDERPSPEESAALTAAGFVSRQERDAVHAVDEAARELLKAIAAAEAAGLTVMVQQRHDHGAFFPQIRTVDIAVDITKRLR